MTKERACANNPAMSRRTILTMLPATGAALALPATAASREVDPLVPLYHEWLDARREWRELADLPGNGNFDHPASKAAEELELALRDQILSLTPTSVEGIAALAALAWESVEPGCNDPREYERRAQSPECRAVKAIWKACTGKVGYPEI